MPSWLTGKDAPWIIALIVLPVLGFILGTIFGPLLKRFGIWLEHAISGLGMGRRFERDYLTSLIEDHKTLNIRGLKTKTPVSIELEKVYISLRAQNPERALDDALAHRSYSIGDVLNRHTRLTIIGGPGCGKTTLLAYLTLTFARDLALKRLALKEKRLPIFVPLRQLSAAAPLADFLTDFYQKRGLRPSPDFFDVQLRAGNCLVLLDGLDEVADEAGRRAMSEWVDVQVTTCPKNRFIVTSRPAGYDTAPLTNGFTVYAVRDFEMSEVEAFVHHWYLAVETAAEDNATTRKQAADSSEALIKAIQGVDAIRKLTVNPLLLSITALVHRYRGSLPRRRVDLYAECIDVLLGHWDEAKGLAGRLTAAQKRAVLQPVAFEMHRRRVRELRRAELEALLSEPLSKVGGQAGETVDFLNEVRDRSGLLVEASPDVFTFSHLTFQEYLAAVQATVQDDARIEVIKNLQDKWWQEVALLYAGLRDATELVEAAIILQYPVGLRLAGHCLFEAAEIKPAVRQGVISALERLYKTSKSTEELLETGEILASIAGDDTVSFFAQRMQVTDDKAAQAAALALAHFGKTINAPLERLLRHLLPLLADDIRWPHAIVILSEIGLPRLLGRLPTSEIDKLLAAIQARCVKVLPIIDGKKLPEIILMARLLDLAVVRIPAGEFTMGSNEKENQQPIHRLTLPDYYLARYPVTNAQYARFIETNGASFEFPAEKAAHPVVNVSWHNARAYAEWVGGRLPTEAEWEKAARGPLTHSGDERRWPWGSRWDATKCNTREAGKRGTTRVGTYSPAGNSPYDVADMAGNVWEWCSSLYKSYPYKSNDGREDLKAHGYRVLRGGSWSNGMDGAQVTSRYIDFHAEAWDYSGFRVVGVVPASWNH